MRVVVLDVSARDVAAISRVAIKMKMKSEVQGIYPGRLPPRATNPVSSVFSLAEALANDDWAAVMLVQPSLWLYFGWVTILL